MSWKDNLSYWFNAPISGWSIYGSKGVYMFKDHRPWEFHTRPRYSFGGWEHVKSKIKLTGKHCGRHCYYGQTNNFKRTAYGYRFSHF